MAFVDAVFSYHRLFFSKNDSPGFVICSAYAMISLVILFHLHRCLIFQDVTYQTVL